MSTLGQVDDPEGILTQSLNEPCSTGEAQAEWFDVDAILAQPALQFASRVFQQVKELEHLACDKPPNLPIFQLAEMFGRASIDKQQELTAHLVRGYAEMELGQRTEVTRLIMRVWMVLRKSGGDIEKLKDTERSLAALNDPESLSAEEIQKHQKTLEEVEALSQQPHSAMLLVMSLLKLLVRTGINRTRLPLTDLLMRLSIATARAFVELGLFRGIVVLLEVVTALDKEERKLLIEEIAGCMNSPDMGFLDKVLGPGGVVDHVVDFLRRVGQWIYCSLLPVLELFLSFVLKPRTALVVWLCLDSICWLVALFAGYGFSKAFHGFLLHGLEDLTEYTEKKTPDAGREVEASMSSDTRRWLIGSIVALCVFLLALVVGLISGLVAVVLLMIWLLHSSIASYVICLVFVVLRFLLTAAITYTLAWTVKELLLIGENSERQSEKKDYGTMPRV